MAQNQVLKARPAEAGKDRKVGAQARRERGTKHGFVPHPPRQALPPITSAPLHSFMHRSIIDLLDCSLRRAPRARSPMQDGVGGATPWERPPSNEAVLSGATRICRSRLRREHRK